MMRIAGEAFAESVFHRARLAGFFEASTISFQLVGASMPADSRSQYCTRRNRGRCTVHHQRAVPITHNGEVGWSLAKSGSESR